MCKQTEDGEITQMHTKVQLRGDRGEFYPRSMKDFEKDMWVKRKVITAQGYARLNTWIGVTFSSPPNINIGESSVGNPYIERMGASVQRVTVRRVGIARNAAGSLSAIDLTVTYDLDDYLIGEVWAKWQPQRKQNACAAWGRVLGDPTNANVQENEKMIECPGGIYLVVDLSKKEVLELWSAHLQRQKFAERNAVSICERNILKRFVGASYCEDNGCIDIVHWSQPDRNIQQMEQIAGRIQRGEVKVDGMDVQAESYTETVDSEEVAAALYGEGEDAPEFSNAEEEEPIGDVVAEMRKAWSGAPQDKRSKALAAVGLKSPAELKGCQNRETMRKVTEILAS